MFLESENPSSKKIFDKTVQLVEKLSGIINFVIAKVTPVCWIFPKVIISYFLYITTNFENEVFELPVYIW